MGGQSIAPVSVPSVRAVGCFVKAGNCRSAVPQQRLRAVVRTLRDSRSGQNGKNLFKVKLAISIDAQISLSIKKNLQKHKVR